MRLMSVPARADTPRCFKSWLPLSDPLTDQLTPLTLAMHQNIIHGRARTLNRALHLADPERLAGRLVGQHQGQFAVHTERLLALTAPLPPAMHRAYHQALGVAAQEDSTLQLAGGQPRPNLLRLPTLRRQANQRPHLLKVADGQPASTSLTLALEALHDDPSAVSHFNAALCSALLRKMTRHWLEDHAALHLELLTSLEDDTHPTAQAATQHVLTTLSGARRRVAKALINETRKQHLNLKRHHETHDALMRVAVRALVRCARQLTKVGALSRIAEAHWLTPWELRDALDGTLERRSLARLVSLRRAAASQTTPVPAQSIDSVQIGLPLSPGVRDGLLHRFVPGVRPPAGAVVLCPQLAPARLFQLSSVGALLVLGAGEHSRVAAYARERALSALSLPALPDWCEDGALVRLNAHQGTLTLLRRAGEAPPVLAPEPFDLDLNNLLEDIELPHVRIHRGSAAFNLEFEPA